VVKFVLVKRGDLGDPVGVLDQVGFGADEDLVCRLTSGPGENAAVRRDEQFLELGRRPAFVE
jgi:hypothetical protein